MAHQEKADFRKLQHEVERNYCSALNEFYKAALQAPIADVNLTIVINFNKELFAPN